MEDIVKIIIGVVVLVLGLPIGDYLAKITKEELKLGQFWFRAIITVSLIGGFIGLITGSDALLFTFFFIAIVTSRSLKK